MRFPSYIPVVDVTARDGLQSLTRWIDTDTKVKLIDRLSDAGYKTIEVSGFGSERALPMLKDAEQVFERIQRRKGVVYRGLAPNAYGAKRAVFANVDEVIGSGTTTFDLLAVLAFDRVMGVTIVIAALEIALVSVMAGLFAVLYNVTVGITGGIEVTLSDSV